MKSFKGKLRFKKDWCFVEISQDFISELSFDTSLLRINQNLHISVIKDELLKSKESLWGVDEGLEIDFFYDDSEILTNGLHNWVNVTSSQLCDIREKFGVPTLRDSETNEFQVLFHITIGKGSLVSSVLKTAERQLRLTARTHIDPKTMIQHI